MDALNESIERIFNDLIIDPIIDGHEVESHIVFQSLSVCGDFKRSQSVIITPQCLAIPCFVGNGISTPICEAP